MKAGFSLTKRYVPTFKGNDKLSAAEQMVAVLSMPEVGEVFQILDRLQAGGFESGDEKKLTMTQAISLVTEAGHLVPKYVKLENAEDFTIDDVVKFPPFFQLAAELMFALVDFAQPDEDDTKNS